jgi:hypothetical protein
MQVSGRLHALPARRSGEEGSYLWIEAGELHEAVVAEGYLPAVAPDRLDGALGIGTGSVRSNGGDLSGDLHLRFGRVRDGRGVLTLTGAGVDADVRFELLHQPPAGGFCPHCGSALEVGVVEVITPPDGGIIGTPPARCATHGDI